MTLRLRLVLALVGLVALAQAGFFVGTYAAYRASQYDRLDTQLRASEPLVDQELDQAAGGGTPGSGGGTPGNGGGFGAGQPSSGGAQPEGPGRLGGPGPQPPLVILPPGTYAELRTAGGTVVSRVQLSDGTVRPKLPAAIAVPPLSGRFLTTGANGGPGTFRVLEVRARDGGVTVIAIPTKEVANALHRLVLIELAALGGLLFVLSAGAWLVLRRGLRPLERMATMARTISGGDFSPRVDPDQGGREVTELGQAFNAMLDDIQAAFDERAATEQRLRQFLADASHELRTPLTSIQGFAELFRVSGDDARVDLPTILRRIEDESARMTDLVEDLLLLARLDERRPLQKAPVDLAVLAADACSDAVASDARRPVRLEAPVPVIVDGDESHLRQAVGNLVTNALRHTPPGSPLEVSAHRVDGRGVFSVRDHGSGLDDDALSHVFDRFWQADRARVGTGAGLGLSIVAAIADEHAGAASAVNEAGGGARFTLSLPLRPDEERL